MPFIPDKVQPQSSPAPTSPQPQETSFLGKIVKSVTDPFMRTGKNIGGAAFELGRVGASSLGFNPYINQQTGEAVENPFLSMQELEKVSQPLSLKKGGALDQQLRDSANIGSYAVPFGKGANIVTKALAPGAAVGGLQALSDEDATAGSVATSALTGAATAGFLDKLMGVGKAAKGAGKSLKTSVVKPKVSASPFMAEEEAKIVDTLTELGIGGSAASQKQQLPKVFRELSDEIEARLVQDTTKVPKSKLKTIINEALENSINYDATILTQVKAKDKYINQILKQAEGSGIGGQALFKAKQNLGNQLGRAFDKLEKGVPLTEKEEIAMTIWGALDELMPKSIKELTRKQSILYKAAPGIQKSAASPGGLSIFGNKVPLSGEISQSAAHKLGSGLEKAGALTEVPDVIKNIAMSGGSRTPGVLTNAAQEPTIENNEVSGSLMSETQAGSTLPPQVEQAAAEQDGKITVEQVQAVLMSPEISQKTKQAIVEAFELQQKYGSAAPKKPLSSAQLQVQGKAKSGLQAVDVIEKLINEDPDLMTRAAVPNLDLLKGQDRKLYEAAISSITDAIGGLRTGASVSKEQQAFYANMLPKPGDDPVTIAAKLQAVREELGGYLGMEITESAPTMP